MLSISCLNFFWWRLWGLLSIESYHLQINILRLFSFPIYVLYICFPYIITLAGISRTILNKSGDYEPMNTIVLFLVLVEMLWVFPLFGIMLRFAIHNFAMLISAPLIPSTFNRKGWWILSQGFSAYLETTMWFLSLRPLM